MSDRTLKERLETAFQVLGGTAPKPTMGKAPEPEIRERPEPEVEEPGTDELARASRLLSEAGVRLMEINGVFTVGIWSDLDSPALRAAIRMFHDSGMPPIRYLDGPGIPPEF